jgi:hypothetical protein
MISHSVDSIIQGWVRLKAKPSVSEGQLHFCVGFRFAQPNLPLEQEIAPLKNEKGFEQIAVALGVPRPMKKSSQRGPK